MNGALRFKDPAALYTNRVEEDKPNTKPADIKSFFAKYLGKSGIDNGVPFELRKDFSTQIYITFKEIIWELQRLLQILNRRQRNFS